MDFWEHAKNKRMNDLEDLQGRNGGSANGQEEHENLQLDEDLMDTLKIQEEELWLEKKNA